MKIEIYVDFVPFYWMSRSIAERIKMCWDKKLTAITNKLQNQHRFKLNVVCARQRMEEKESKVLNHFDHHQHRMNYAWCGALGEQVLELFVVVQSVEVINSLTRIMGLQHEHTTHDRDDDVEAFWWQEKSLSEWKRSVKKFRCRVVWFKSSNCQIGFSPLLLMS